MITVPPQHRKKATIVAACMALAAPCEGLRQVAYRDPPGIVTVCDGHTGAGIVEGKKYSLAECSKFFTDDMTKAVNLVEACQPGLPDKVLIAFADATFNMGPTIACNMRASTAARMLSLARTSSGDYSPACRQLPRWDKASVGGVMVSLPGLTKRRHLEQDICLEWQMDVKAAQ